MKKAEKVAKQLREDGANGLTVQLCVDLYLALVDLTEISGEANIPMNTSKDVRKMARFVAARQHAIAAIASADGAVRG